MSETSPQVHSRRHPIGVAVLDSGLEFRSPSVRDAVRAVNQIDLNGTVLPLPADAFGRWPDCDWDDKRHGTIMCEILCHNCPDIDLYVYRLPPVPEPPRAGIAVETTLLPALEQIAAVEQIAVVNVSQSLFLDPRQEALLLPSFRGVLQQLADNGKVVIMASGNGDRCTEVTPLPGCARPGYTVGSADYCAGWCRVEDSLSRWLHFEDFVPDGYAHGRWPEPDVPDCWGTSIAASRVSQYAARAVRHVLAGVPGVLTPHHVNTIYACLADAGDVVVTHPALFPDPDRRCAERHHFP